MYNTQTLTKNICFCTNINNEVSSSRSIRVSEGKSQVLNFKFQVLKVIMHFYWNAAAMWKDHFKPDTSLTEVEVVRLKSTPLVDTVTIKYYCIVNNVLYDKILAQTFTLKRTLVLTHCSINPWAAVSDLQTFMYPLGKTPHRTCIFVKIFILKI